MKNADRVKRMPMCCDHCSDTKFPCAYIDQKMKTVKDQDKGAQVKGRNALDGEKRP